MDSGFQLSEGIQVDLEEQEELHMQRQVFKKGRATTSYLGLKYGIPDRTQPLKVTRENVSDSVFFLSDKLNGNYRRKKISKDFLQTQ